MKYLFYFFLTFAAITSTSSHAYFLIPESQEMIRIDLNEFKDNESKINEFHIFDNTFQIGDNQILNKRLKHFISIDKITIDIPLRILSRNSILPEETIDRIILANLRMKKLLEDYESLQKKNQSLMAQISDSIANYNASRITPNSIYLYTKSDITNYPEAIKAEKKKLAETLSNIVRLSKINHEIPFNNNLFVENFSQLNQILETQKKTNNRISFFDFSITESDINRVSQTYKRPQRVISKQTKIELPWVFEFFLNLINYILRNKMETFLYLLFTTLLVLTITRIIRQ